MIAWTSRDDLRLTIRMGLTRVRGTRRQLSEEERDRIADAIIDDWICPTTGSKHGRRWRAMAGATGMMIAGGRMPICSLK